MYNKPNDEFIAKLKAAVSGSVYVGEDINEDYSHDEMDFAEHYMPDVVVQVNSTEEVSAVCKLCYEYEIPFTPRGAGTGLSGACVALAGGVIIDMTKMNKILSYDLENFTVRLQPGVLVDTIQKDALAHGVMYAPDPGEKLATVGGNVSTNAGGMRAVKYGCTRDAVRAMTVVLPTGEVMRFGGEVSKNCSGYSLMNLVSGSEGTLCIITELSMKLTPLPAASVSLLGMFPDLESACYCVSKIKLANLDPESIELMEVANVVDTHEYLGKKVYPTEVEGTPVAAYILSTIPAASEEEMEAKMEQAAEVFVENGALDVSVFDTPDAISNAWSVRGQALEMLKEKFKLMEEADVVVPIPNIPEYIRYAKQVGEELGCEVRCTGHAGDGNIHANVCTTEQMPREEFAKIVETFVNKLCDKGIELNGLVSGEHGIGYSRVPHLTRAVGEEEMALMKRIKAAFDPKMLLNPGKVCYSL